MLQLPVSQHQSVPLFKRPATLVVIVFFTVVAWGGIWWQQSQSAPVRAHIEAGIDFLKQGKGEVAEQEWKSAIRLSPRNAQAWELLGDYYLAVGNGAAAREAFEQLLEIQPQTEEIHYRLAVSNAQANDLKQARQHAEEEIKANPNDPKAIEALVSILAQTGEQQDLRLKYLRQLAELQPQSEKYVVQLADILVAQKKYSEALPLIEKILKLNPDYAPAYAMRGAARFYTDTSSEGLARAEADLQKSLLQDPGDEVARLFLGKVYLRQRQPRKAVVELRKLEGLPSANESYLLEMANAYQMLGERAKAKALRAQYASIEESNVQLKKLQLKVDENPKDFESILKMGILLLDSHKPIGAEDYIVRALTLRPADERARAALTKLETRYTGYLKSAAQSLEHHDYAAAGHAIGRAMLLRPDDARTRQAVQNLEMASLVGNQAGQTHSPSRPVFSGENPTPHKTHH